MSTSPSWFDQEKFSRLVKKVGPKTVTEPLPLVAPKTDDAGAAAQGGPSTSTAPTAHISLVSRPTTQAAEHRALPALPRRTAPLPALKSLFPNPETNVEEPATEVAESTDAATSQEEPAENAEAGAIEGEPNAAAPAGHDGDLAETWERMSQLNEELAYVIHERDHAQQENAILREQLEQAETDLDKQGAGAAPSGEELEKLTRERDDAVKKLGEQASGKAPTKELFTITSERDTARKDYANLRQQFESLKKEQGPKIEPSDAAQKEELEKLRLELKDKFKEIAVLKANGTPGPNGSGGGDADRLKQELALAREQLTRAKDEASVAQRGLALSQKALHETRDTLREATEGTSLSRHNFDNLKAECAALSQQNTVLQAKVDQLTRDLAATKSKLTTRL